MQNSIWEIIAAKINGEVLTLEEQSILQEWLKSEVENQVVLKKLEKYYFDYKQEKYIDVDAAYQICIKKLQEKRKTRYLRSIKKWAYAASVLLLFSFSFYYFFQDKPVRMKSMESLSIQGGETKAVLTLASGETIALSLDKTFTFVEKGQVISNKEDGLICSVTGDSLVSSEENLEYRILEVPRGGEYPLELEDGTRIWVNSESRLRFPSVWGAKERRVYIDGEAFFEVKRDLSRPFIVTSKGIDIRVLGTKFNVASYEGTSEIFTTLVEGAVAIQSDERSLGVLKPGEQAVFDSLTGQMNVRQVDVALYISWKDGYYKFEGTTLEEIMNTLARWYNIEIHYASEELKGIRFSGRIKRYGDIREFLEILKGTYDVDFQIDNRTITVNKK
ncbi:FecR family protein [Gabonibacter chumensis]|uniref:FecR family protein n=1 Tax=Gabonibacter chumensis TaxID=2972474 RepID=UPI00257360C2|nr:FecR domain-containing protein [Gabonibacter chumensis]MCR9013306.1 DUF4974 domain-containing protein [Gabonibacter chumensis]